MVHKLTKFVLFAYIAIILSSASYAEHIHLVEDSEYGLELFSSDYNSKDIHKLLLRVKLKDHWKFLLKRKNDKNINPIISIKNSAPINSVNITWPEPRLEEANSSYIYDNEVLIPIKIHTKSSYEDLKLSIDLDFVLCNDSCLRKKHNFTIAIPGKDYDFISYELIKSLSESKILDEASRGQENTGIFMVLLLAFAGGMILNFMPCVLPVISLKILSLIKAKKSEARGQFISTSLGSISFFVLLGIILSSFKSMGQHVGLGFNFQYPIFLVTIALLIVIFASILNNTLHIDIPEKARDFMLKYSEQTKLGGSFLSGMFAALLATPCTAPFLGVAISAALVLSTAEMLLTFAFMGAGMALPFILLSIFPQATSFIPKPGPWIKWFNKTLEIMLYLTVMWLIWVFYSQMGFYPALALFLSCLLLKFLLEKRSELKNHIKILLIGVVLIVSYAIPIKTSVLEFQREKIIDATWRAFDSEKIQAYIDEGKVVVVDITAEWCLTCKYNKVVVWDNPFMIRFLNENGIVAMRGDYTSSNKEITEFLKSYSRYGIPFSLVYNKSNPNGIILPPVLTYGEAMETIKKALYR